MKSGRPEDLGTFAVERDALTGALTDWAGAQADALIARSGAKAEGDGAGAPDLYALWGEGSPERQAKLSALIQGHTERLALLGAWGVLDVYNESADGWSADVMTGWLAAAAASHASQYEQAGYAAALSALTSPDGWQAGLKAAMAAWVVGAARRAVTAATEARSFGGHDAAGASGLVYKVWHTGGKNPRASHRALDGDRVELGDVFANGLRWPGDGHGKAAETSNCNCRLTYERGE